MAKAPHWKTRESIYLNALESIATCPYPNFQENMQDWAKRALRRGEGYELVSVKEAHQLQESATADVLVEFVDKDGNAIQKIKHIGGQLHRLILEDKAVFIDGEATIYVFMEGNQGEGDPSQDDPATADQEA